MPAKTQQYLTAYQLALARLNLPSFVFLKDLTKIPVMSKELLIGSYRCLSLLESQILVFDHSPSALDRSDIYPAPEESAAKTKSSSEVINRLWRNYTKKLGLQNNTTADEILRIVCAFAEAQRPFKSDKLYFNLFGGWGQLFEGSATERYFCEGRKLFNLVQLGYYRTSVGPLMDALEASLTPRQALLPAGHFRDISYLFGSGYFTAAVLVDERLYRALVRLYCTLPKHLKFSITDPRKLISSTTNFVLKTDPGGAGGFLEGLPFSFLKTIQDSNEVVRRHNEARMAVLK